MLCSWHTRGVMIFPSGTGLDPKECRHESSRSVRGVYIFARVSLTSSPRRKLLVPF